MSARSHIYTYGTHADIDRTHDKKTIEGDLFQAFVAAGAISKANADDPKKSSFVRCARTDKGVHAAGNVISLKLIVEDEDVVKKVNEALVPQIRVWGIERTNNSFSSYQLVDSRIYEYLIPTHSFLPPHPRSFMGRKCEEWASKKAELDQWRARQEEVESYWEKVDAEVIKPILDDYDEETRSILEKALYLHGEDAGTSDKPVEAPSREEGNSNKRRGASPVEATGEDASLPRESEPPPQVSEIDTSQPGSVPAGTAEQSTTEPDAFTKRSSQITDAIKRLRQAYLTAKREYRIPASRLDRVRKCLSLYIGTKNFHNFTVDKTFRDPSANRVIKSFVVNEKPITINGTEWLSLKVHGQSFMMHQIRKMIGMVALVVRCGCDPLRISEAMGVASFSIPKAPSLGLLLERPIFNTYNQRAGKEFGKEAIDFDKFKAEMDEFKQREIYERMYRDEEKDNVFGNFFNHVDNYPEPTFLYVTSGGVEATKTEEAGAGERVEKKVPAKAEADGESEDDTKEDDKLGAEG